MKKIYADLWQTERHSSGILNTHAYFLQRENGNVLFYNTSAENDIDEMDELGGISYQLLTHRDEVGGSLAGIRERFGTQLGIGALEARFATRFSPVDLAFEPADTRLDDIQIIHTPGHSDGSICYYYESPHGKSYLFTGDTFFQSHGRWSTFVIASFGSTHAALADSLEKLRELSPDVVMSSGFVGEVAFREVTQSEWREALDKAIKSSRAKAGAG